MRKLTVTALAVATVFAAQFAWAQSDPKVKVEVTPELVPNEVTLSGDGSGTKTGFIGRGAMRFKISNGGGSDLNHAKLTLSTTVVAGTPETVISGQTAAFEPLIPGATLAVSGELPGCTIVSPATLSCNFGDDQLNLGNTSEFIVVFRSPVQGERVKLVWNFGSDEGKSQTNGCCTQSGTVYTTLIDSAVNPTVYTHVQSFAVKNVLNEVYTGLDSGKASAVDPWATLADLGNGYGSLDYTKAAIDEQETSSTGSCSPLNKNKCWRSQINVPNTTWLPENPLWITMERHSSIIKNGSKLSDYVNSFEYAKTESSGFQPVPLCADTLTGGPTSGAPCLASKAPNTAPCVERPLATSPPTYIWSCTAKAVDNGFYRTR